MSFKSLSSYSSKLGLYQSSFSIGSVHLETDSLTFEVRCVVARARPRPEFMWYLDDILLEEIEKKDYEGKTYL